MASKATYVFKEFDKRALTGALILELVHPKIQFNAVKSENCLIETLIQKSGQQQSKTSGFFTILNQLNPKLSSSVKEIDFTWRVCYGLTYMETVIKKKKASTSIKINETVLVDIENSIQKTPFLGGKNPNELDVVIFCNVNDIFAKDTEKYRQLYPRTVKLVENIREKSEKIIDQYNTKFPKQSKADPKKDAKKDPKKDAATTKPEESKKGEQPAKAKGQKKGDGKGGNPEKAKQPAPTKPAQQARPKKEVDPALKELLNKCKIRRVNKGEVILPSKEKKNILITSALPYVNNVPHLGNLIGCVLSADVYARWARLRGHNAVYICGTDQYGTATETKALAEGKTPKEICDHYHKIHTAVYEWFDIDFDHWGQTSTPKQTEICQSIFKDLQSKGLTVEDTLKQPKCEKCVRFLADRFIIGTCPHCNYDDARGDQCDSCGKILDPSDLKNRQCHICKSEPIDVETKHIFLDLPKIQPKLEEFIKKKSVEGRWSNNSVSITNSWVGQGLKQRCITRDLKWGVPVPVEGYENKVFYVWFDAPIGYISITANYTDQWQQWWKNPDNVKLVQFMGKDNVPFHTVIFPSCLLGTGDNWSTLDTISTTEYLNYEKGLKFSKSRGTGVFGTDAQDTQIPSEVWRYYLLVNRPESSDSEFDWDDFSSKINSELLANIGNLCQRSLSFAFSNYKEKVPEFDSSKLTQADNQVLKDVFAKFQDYNEAFDKVEIKRALRIAMEISQICNKYMQDSAPWDKTKKESGQSSIIIFVLVNLLRFLSLIFEPFMPSFSAKVNYILGKEVRTKEDEVLIETLLRGNESGILELMQPNHKLNKPIPLFEKLEPEDIEEYRKRYSSEK